MTREEIIDKMFYFSAPHGIDLAKFNSYYPKNEAEEDALFFEEMKEETRQIRKWVDSLPMDNLSIFLDIVLHPIDSSQKSGLSFIESSLPYILNVSISQFKMRDIHEFDRISAPFLQYDVVREMLEEDIDEGVEDLLMDDCIDAIAESHNFAYADNVRMSDDDWRVYIIRAIDDALCDIENGDNCRLLAYYIRGYNADISNPAKIKSAELNAIWNFADVTFFHYNHSKKEKWMPLLKALRESVELLKTGQTITDSWVLGLLDTHLKRDNSKENHYVNDKNSELRQCIIKAIYDGLKDMENGVEVGLSTSYTTNCDEYLNDLSKIDDDDLRVIWDFAEETFFYYQHKEEPWKEMAVKLREMVVELENNQPVKDSNTLKDAYQMLQNVKPQGCLLSLLNCFILHK